MTCYITRCYQACDYSHLSSKNVEGAKTMILEGIVKTCCSYSRYIDTEQLRVNIE